MKTSLAGSFFGMEAFKIRATDVDRSDVSPFPICAMRKMAVVETVGDEVSDAVYFPLSWQSPPPTSRALTLSLTRPEPLVVGRYFWVT